jgi:hypothetical protein
VQCSLSDPLPLSVFTRCHLAPPARSSLEHQIAATDRQIDRIVYDLYGLTEEEIRSVEERAGG